MRYHKLITLLLVFTLVTPFFNQSSAIQEAPLDKSKIVQNQILVKYKDSSKKESTKNKLKAKKKVKEVKAKEKIKLKEKKVEKEVELLEFSQDADFDSVLRELQSDPNVELAEPNYLVTLCENDPDYPNQWGLENTGQTIFGQSGTAGKDIHVSSVRAITKGSAKVIVAVLDGGMDVRHPDLSHSIFVNSNETADGIDNDRNGLIDDVSGWNFAHGTNQLMQDYDDALHATHVAGIIAADINGNGTEGIAPEVKILPLKFIENRYGNTADAIKAIQYAESMGAAMVNCSWGSYYRSELLKTVIESSNMLFVCAAGNDGLDVPMYPASYALDNVISVAAMNNRGALCDFSNFGGNTTIAAPGEAIYSTAPNNNYAFLNGTSMAAPFVSGVSALLLSVTTLSVTEIKQRLCASATMSENFAGKVQAGGFLNAAGAFQLQSDSEFLTVNKYYGAASASLNGVTYSVGGYDESGYSGQLSYFDPVTDRWYRLPAMPTARIHAGAVFLGTDLYVIGGYNGTPLDTVEKYDTLSKTWSTVEGLGIPLYSPAVFSDEKKIYVVGGVGEKRYIDLCFEYITYQDDWGMYTLPFAAAGQAVCKAGGKTYLIGGLGENGPMNSIYEYIPDRGYEKKANLISPRHSAGAAALDGRIYILGGLNSDGTDIQNRQRNGFYMQSALTTAEVYDPKSDTCTQIIDMSQPRLGFSVNTRTNGIFIDGGWMGVFLDDAEKYRGAIIPAGLRALSPEIGMELTWLKTEGAEGYDLEINRQIVPIDGADTVSYALPADSVCDVRIRARFAEGCGAWSDYLRTYRNGTMEDAKPVELAEDGRAEVTGSLSSGNPNAWYQTTFETAGNSEFSMRGAKTLGFDLYDGTGYYLVSGHLEETGLTTGNLSLAKGVYYIKVYQLSSTEEAADFTLNIQYTPLDLTQIPDRVFVNTIEGAALEGDPVIQTEEEPLIRLVPKEYKLTATSGTSANGFSVQPQATANIDAQKLRQDKTLNVQGVLRNYGDIDEYYVTLQAKEKLAAVVDAPGANEYGVFIYKEGTASSSSWTIFDNFENPERKTICEVVAPSAGRYRIQVQPRQGQGSPLPYTMTLYLVQPDSFEPNYFAIPETSKLLPSVGDRTTLPLQYGNLTIDHPRDKDYYRIQNVGPNEKITMSVYLYGNNVEKYDKYSFELWRLKDRTRLDDGWYEFHFASYEYKNAAMTTAMDRKGAKVMSFVTGNVGTTENDTTYYLVVRESEHNTIVDPNSYSLACTKIPLDHMEAEDAYEIRDGNNLTNDFILANGLDYTTLLADNAPVNAVLDNFLDVDWYRIEIPKEGIKKKFELGGSYARNNYGMLMMGAEGGLKTVAASGGSPELTYIFPKAGKYYIGVYSSFFTWSENTENQKYSLTMSTLASESFTLSGAAYNHGAGPKLGKENTVTFQLKKASEDTKKYTVKLLCAWDDGEGWQKSSDQEKTFYGTTEQTFTFDNILLSGGGSGNVYTYVKVYEEGSAYGCESNRVSSRISGIMPQEVKFDYGLSADTGLAADGKKHFNIFDDNPEHLRECDLFDGMYNGVSFAGNAITRFARLEPGVYTLCSSHNTGGGYLKSGFGPFTKPVYFDLAFYNATVQENVEITKIGYDSFELRAADYNAWLDYWNKKYYPPAFGTDSPTWLSDILKAHYFENPAHSTLLCEGSEWGSMELELEFEVKSGTVDLVTMAYHERPTDAAFNQLDDAGKINAPYETLETLKGMGNTMSTITADFEYYIDESVLKKGGETRLPVGITNLFFNNRKLDFFSTHNTPVSENNRCNMVGSSTVPLTYKGYGVKERWADGNPKGTNVYSEADQWTFDAAHVMDIGGKPIPEGIRQYFGGRDTFLPNERFPDSFVQNFFVPDDAVLAREDPGAYTQRDVILKDLLETKEYMSERREETPSVNPGFGLKNVYRVAVHNNGADPHAFSYLFKGDGYDINWSASTGENGHLYLDDTIMDTPCEVFRVNIPAGQTVYITFDVSIICGKNPTAHNAFAIDVPSNILFSYYDDFNEKFITKYLLTLYNKENARDYAYLNP